MIHIPHSAKEDEPQREREQGDQTRIYQNWDNNRNVQAQQQPSGESSKQNGHGQADEPRREE
jgi:hypothetical protein